MNFLKYIELSAENLQFYLWFRDYSKRFNELPESEKDLSPEWSADMANQNEVKPMSMPASAHAAAMLKGSDFADDKMLHSERGGNNPFFTPPRTPTSLDRRDESLDSCTDSMMTDKVDHAQRAAGAFENAGLKWKPRKSCFTHVYFLPGCPAHVSKSLFSRTARRSIASFPSTSPMEARAS